MDYFESLSGVWGRSFSINFDIFFYKGLQSAWLGWHLVAARWGGGGIYFGLIPLVKWKGPTQVKLKKSDFKLYVVVQRIFKLYLY